MPSNWFYILLSVFILTSCQSPPKPSVTRFSQNIMTIDYHIQIGESLTSERQQVAQSIISQTFKEINDGYNKWNKHSEISYINQLDAHIAYYPSPKLYQFLIRINELVRFSKGRFDPTIEPLQNLWISCLEQGITPTAEQLENLKNFVGWDHLILENGHVIKKDKRLQIDLGGIAKGLCVDWLLLNLNQAGFTNVYVEWGGEIRTSGLHPDNRPWRIFISRLGDSNPQEALDYVELTDQALATSGDYYRRWSIIDEKNNEKIYCHIMNPLTFQALEVKKGSVASASLRAKDCVTADALAKVSMLFDSSEERTIWWDQVESLYADSAHWIILN